MKNIITVAVLASTLMNNPTWADCWTQNSNKNVMDRHENCVVYDDYFINKGSNALGDPTKSFLVLPDKKSILLEKVKELDVKLMELYGEIHNLK